MTKQVHPSIKNSAFGKKGSGKKIFFPYEFCRTRLQGIRLVRADQRNREELDNMLLKGIHSGPATLLDMKSLKVKAKSQLKAMQNKKR